MKESLKKCCMVAVLLVILIIVLIILYPFLNKKKENFKLKNNNNCCGNADWYLGNKLYNKMCKKNLKENFENQEEEMIMHYQEEEQVPIAKPIKFKKNFIEQDDEALEETCENMGLKPAYSPSICTVGEGLDMKYDFNRNCKCADSKNTCKVCYPKPNWPSLT